PLQLDHMCLTAKQRMRGVHAEFLDLPLGGHRCASDKRFEWSVTEKERHALAAPFRQPNDGRRRLRVAFPSDTATLVWRPDDMRWEPRCALLDWEWLREREYSLRALALADDRCCNRSRFFQSRIRSRLVDPRRLSIVYSRTRSPSLFPDE